MILVVGGLNGLVTEIYSAFGQGFLIDPDLTIFVPLAVAQSITHVYTYNNVLVRASSASIVNQVASEITNLFGSNNIHANTVSSFLSVQQSISQGIGTLLETVAGISVLVAFIGIMTTMFTSVLERTREIGILKALGASGRNIMLTFLSEAALRVILLQGNSGSPGVGGPKLVGGPSSLGSTLPLSSSRRRSHRS
jgi:putative ABC transport system permease protein